jgi:hypothetical protein
MKPRLQFRLRTLLIVVTVLAVPCAYVAHEAHAVQNRRVMRQALFDDGVVVMEEDRDVAHPDESPSWFRRWLGDSGVSYIGRRIGQCPYSDDEIGGMFPEAELGPFGLPEDTGLHHTRGYF